LALLVLATGGALALYAVRLPVLKYGAPFSPVSREGGLVINNLLLVAAAATVFLGTFYPLFIDLMGRDKISVGPPFYARTFVPIMIPLMIAMAVGPTLKWKRDSLKTSLPNLKAGLVVAVGGALLIAGLTYGQHLLTAMGVGLSLWIICGSLLALANRMKLGRTELTTSLKLARNAPRSFYGLVIAHMGFGFVVGAVTCVSTWQQENILSMSPGETANIAGYSALLKSVQSLPGPNYDADRGTFEISYNGKPVTTLLPERRFYQVQQQQTTQTGIHTNFISNIYVTLGEQDEQGRWTVRLYYHPLAPWLWLGGLTMALGGFTSLSDRRFRVGAPQRAISSPVAVPAE
jgi:cytochrome c-type biogenesis protein CcmF